MSLEPNAHYVQFSPALLKHALALVNTFAIELPRGLMAAAATSTINTISSSALFHFCSEYFRFQNLAEATRNGCSVLLIRLDAEGTMV